MAKRKRQRFAGYAEFRTGQSRPVSLAGPHRRAEALPAYRREAMTVVVVGILEEWRASKFEFEGACRAGVRSGLCLDGHRWRSADAWAEAIVSEALRRIAAERPTWAEGQPECTQDGFFTVERTRCDHCGKPLPADARSDKRFCSKACRNVAKELRAIKLKRMFDVAEYKAVVAASAQARRQASETRKIQACEYCGDVFSARRAVVRFCSDRCSRASRQRPIFLTCLHCGVVFDAKRKTQKYCSVKCADNAKRIQPEHAASPPLVPGFVCEEVSAE